MSTSPLIPLLPRDRVAGWPKSDGREPEEIGYVDAAEAFSRPWPTDAHFAAYSVPKIRRRLTLEAIGRLSEGWPMVLLAVDVDHPWKRAWKNDKPKSDEERQERDQLVAAWWAGECAKLDALEAAHPGAFVYRSRSGGYRIVYLLASPFVIFTVDDKEAWRTRYRRELLYLARRFRIESDPACSDVTRLYRLPFVTRDGQTFTPELRGDPSAIGTWTHEPSAAELPDDIAAARALAEKDRQAWGATLNTLDPQRGSQEAPAELRPEDQDEERLHKRAAAYLAAMAPSIEGAGGNSALWAAALAMVRGFSLGPLTGATMLERDFNPRCRPAWPRDEIRRACRNAAEKSSHPWGYLRDAEGGEAGLNFKPSERRQRQHQQSPRTPTNEGAPMPADRDDQADEAAPFLPLATPRDLPAFPLHALPGPVAAFASQLTDALECPLDLPACLALGALGSVGMKRFVASPRVDWQEPLNLYVAVALDPGESKSPAFRQIFGPLYALQKQLSDEWKEKCKRIDEHNSKRGKDGPEEPKPARPRLFVDDATPEKIGMIMAEQGERITLASDEGTAFQHMCGLYSKNGQANAGVYLKAHDGGHYVVDRTVRDSIHLEAPLMAVALAVQPTVIRELAKRPDLRGRGLWGRFVYAFPASRVGTRTHEGPPVDPATRDEWRALLMRLASPPLPKEPEVLRLSLEAHRRFHQTEVEIERAMLPGGALSSVRDWAGKLRGLIARLAGLLHMAEDPAPGLTAISVATVERAIDLARYFTAHALYTFNIEMTLDPVEQAARQAWEAIQRKGFSRVTPAEIGRWVRSLRKTPDAVAALEALCRQGCLEPDPTHRGKGKVYLIKHPPEGEGKKQTKADEKQTKNDTVKCDDHQGFSAQNVKNDGAKEERALRRAEHPEPSAAVVLGDLSVFLEKPAAPRQTIRRDADVLDVDFPPAALSQDPPPGPPSSCPPSAVAPLPANDAPTPPAPGADLAAGGESEGYL